MMHRRVFAAAMLLAWPAAQAGESKLLLVNAPGRDQVQANCLICHSADYVLINAGIADRAGWEASIAKMRKVMRATISDADAAIILDYLTKYYGRSAP